MIERDHEQVLAWYDEIAKVSAVPSPRMIIAERVAAERARCVALVELELSSAENEKPKWGGEYLEGWIHALQRLKVKFEDKTDE